MSASDPAMVEKEEPGSASDPALKKHSPSPSPLTWVLKFYGVA